MRSAALRPFLWTTLVLWLASMLVGGWRPLAGVRVTPTSSSRTGTHLTSVPPPVWLAQRPDLNAHVVIASRAGGTEVFSDEPLARMRLKSWVVVKPGDTLWDIAARTHVPLQDIERWNGLTDDSILQIGQVLIVDPEFPPPAPPRTRPAASNAVRFPTLASRASQDQRVAFAAHADATLGGAVANYALRFIGTPYRWGGTTPDGFDCSGFVQYVYAHFGVRLPRTSGEQFGAGLPVAFSALSAGDLVFFDANGPGPTHVGIYIGDGRFVDAGSDGVGVDSFSNSYWRAHYVGARRVTGGT
jgi:peptidoglycan endopeptidase LytE